MNYPTVFHLISAISEKAGISRVLIGGFAVNYYKYTRQTADVDFLITREDFDKISGLLEKEDYEQDYAHEVFVLFRSKSLYLIDIVMYSGYCFAFRALRFLIFDQNNRIFGQAPDRHINGKGRSRFDSCLFISKSILYSAAHIVGLYIPNILSMLCYHMHHLRHYRRQRRLVGVGGRVGAVVSGVGHTQLSS